MPTTKRTLYPEIEPYKVWRLKVDALHELHVEECGNPEGLPVVFLHGGPGAGISTQHRRFFDPMRYRAVLFDQRGAGHSTPAGETEDNTTQHLVADIERIRQHLGIERWLVFGGSWGSTLALAYAQAHPQRTRALVLRGLFLGSQWENDWLNERSGGARHIFPEFWAPYEELVPPAERMNLVEAYWRRLCSADEKVRTAAGRAYSAWGEHCGALVHDPNAASEINDHAAVIESKIQVHYLRHRCFLADNQLLDGVARIRHIPATLIQGRYDIVCPMQAAYELAQAWPELKFRRVLAGHSAFDEAIVDALVEACDVYAEHARGGEVQPGVSPPWKCE